MARGSVAARCSPRTCGTPVAPVASFVGWRLMRFLALAVLLLGAACGGSDPVVDDAASPLPDASGEVDLESAPDADATVSTGRPATTARSSKDWVVSVAPRALDGRDDVVALRPADDAGGAPVEDVLLTVHCSGDRTAAVLGWASASAMTSTRTTSSRSASSFASFPTSRRSSSGPCPIWAMR